MDRFIEVSDQEVSLTRKRLKSNMDRFIGLVILYAMTALFCLKSNMDRFIVISRKVIGAE